VKKDSKILVKHVFVLPFCSILHDIFTSNAKLEFIVLIETTNKKLELLVPAGGAEQLFYALHFGADAVYIGGEYFSLRSKAANFSDDALNEAIKFVHSKGKRVYVTVNSVIGEQQLHALHEYIELLGGLNPDAIILSDMAVLALAKKLAPKLAIHVSTQANICNHETARLWHELGASRIVCARELSISDIAELRQAAPRDLELEVFVHGAMCMSYSGRCMISAHLTGRSANEGSCTQPCRWSYALVEQYRQDKPMTIEEDEFGSYVLNSKDLNMLAHLSELRAAGIDSIKIEGRNKKAYYVACVANAYRQVLDGAPASEFASELETISHRPYSTGFFFGEGEQSASVGQYLATHDMVATVVDCTPLGETSSLYLNSDNCHCGLDPQSSFGVAKTKDGTDIAHEKYLVTISLRNRIFEGDELEVLSPNVRPFSVHARELRRIFAEESTAAPALEIVEVADIAMQHYCFVSNHPLKPDDILRVKRKNPSRKN
jgi:putative protease